MLEFYVTKGQELKRRDHDVVSADTTDLKAQFDLTSDFTGTITVWWRRSDKPGSTWTSTLSGNQCTIPAEALSAATDNVMYGEYDHFVFVSISDTGRTTSSECEIKVNKSAFSTNSTPGTGGNPTAYEELVEQFDELKQDNEQFKTDMTEQQAAFESTVTENVDNIRYVVETETAPPIIEEASGAEITLDDSAYRQVRGLNLYGYSKQTQTTGAQLLDYSTLPGAQNGITPSIDDENYIVLNGKATANAFIYVLCNIPPGTSMFISANNPVSNNNISVYIRDEESTYSSEYIALDTANKTHAFASVSVAISRFVVRITQGTTLNDFRLRPMLNSGTSALPWEPYSGGYASPSPDWAQPITSVGDGGSVTVNSVGANLFPALDVQDVAAGSATVRNNNDGSLTMSGSGNLTETISSFNNLNHAETVQRLKAGQYTISGAETGYPYILTSYLYNNDIYRVEANTQTSSGRTIEISQDTLNDVSSHIRFGVYGHPGMTITQQTVWPMFNRGSTPLPWQPYAAPSSALITLTDSLRGIPVSSGGNYTDESGQQWIADYIYRRQTDGKWMIWRNCGRVEYIGGDDENWTYEGAYFRFKTSSGVSNALVVDGRSMVICNRGLYHQSGIGTGYAFIAGGPLFYYSPDSGIDSVDGFKTWLQSNPLEVVYQLATPTIEELPENVQTELNGLYTYNLHTDMWNSDGAYMDLKYVADTKTWINNKIAGLSTAMLSQN